MLFPSLRDPKALRAGLARAFLGSLLATPRGRAHMLTQAALAESDDEGALFDHIATRVDDGELARMVKKHGDDEQRHAALFFGCADRQGVERPEIPEDLRILNVLKRHIDVLDRPVADDHDVMEVYLVLQVIEERAVEQFSLVEPIMRRYDSRTADVLLGIAKDEERHLLYCKAISARYAPSELVRSRRLAELREIEALAFREHQESMVQYVLSLDLLPKAWTWFWKGALDVLPQKRMALPYTRFHGQDLAVVAHAA